MKKNQNGFGYQLSRHIFNWSFENPGETNPILLSLYFFLLEVNNRLAWKETFYITAKECMEAIGISSYNTYKKNFDLLVKFGFIKIVKKSVNQYQANLIAISKFDKAFDKALDKALIKANNNPLNKAPEIINNKETNNNKTNKQRSIDFTDFNFSEISENKIKEFIEYRKEIKKPFKSEKSIKILLNKCSKYTENQIIFVINNTIENGWQGLFWDKAPKSEIIPNDQPKFLFPESELMEIFDEAKEIYFKRRYEDDFEEAKQAFLDQQKARMEQTYGRAKK